MLLRSLLFLFCSGTVAASPLTESDLATARALRDGALKGTSAYAITQSLTSEIGHRMAGSENDAKGVAWAIAKFKELGYTKVYTQPVSFPVWERGFESAEILGASPQSLHIAALGGTIGTPDGGISGEVVHFDDLAALQAAKPDSLDGKIAYVGYRMQRAKDGSGYGSAVMARVAGASTAARAGAIAVLIRSIGTDQASNTPHTGVMHYDDKVKPIPAAALANADADALEQALATGEAVSVKLVLGSRTLKDEYTSANVIAEITGSEFPDEVVAIGGHLDSWDLGTGAIDDAAGIAITMAAGAMIGQLPSPPKRTIRVIAFANEEQGVFGGKEYGRTHADQVAQHIIGGESDFGSGKIWRFSTRVVDSAMPVIDQMYSVLEPMGIERGSNQGSGGADFSAMAALGMPVLGMEQDGSDYFDYHHTAADTLDKVDAHDLDFNVAAYASMVYLAAQAGTVFGPLPVTTKTP